MSTVRLPLKNRLARLFIPAKLPHHIGAIWPEGPIPVFIQAREFAPEIQIAMHLWNASLRPFKRFFRAATKPPFPVRIANDGTQHYADVQVYTSGHRINGAYMRINRERMAPLPQTRRQTIFEHELGHVLGFLHHDGPEPSVTHTKLPPHIPGITEFDRASIRTIYAPPILKR